MFLLIKERTETRPSGSKDFDEESLAGFHHFYVARETWSVQNRISHPHWVKICDDHNGQINLRANQKYKVLSATGAIS